MNILLISFYQNDDNMYPHLRLVLDELKTNFNTEYFCLKERGYGFENIKITNFIKRLFKPLFKDFKNLKSLKKQTKFDKIIAVDHFAYYLASLIFPKEKIIFWSFDTIGLDTPYFKNKIVQFFLKKNRELLKNDGKLIIQNKERLDTLEKTLNLTVPKQNICFMPVFIPDAKIEKTHEIHNDPLMLMQASSFDGCRYTADLVQQFQKDSNYDLYLHGLMFEGNSLKKILETTEKSPIISTLTINPNQVFKIIKRSDIGFIGCKLDELNCKYMYGASGQILEFLRMAKPVISLGPNNLGEILEKNGAGIGIKSIGDLPFAVDKIKQNYESYSKNALKLFEEDFNSDKILNEFIRWIKL